MFYLGIGAVLVMMRGCLLDVKLDLLMRDGFIGNGRCAFFEELIEFRRGAVARRRFRWPVIVLHA